MDLFVSRRLQHPAWASETMLCLTHLHKWPCRPSFTSMRDIMETIEHHATDSALDSDVLVRGLACLREIIRAGPPQTQAAVSAR